MANYLLKHSIKLYKNNGLLFKNYCSSINCAVKLTQAKPASVIAAAAASASNRYGEYGIENDPKEYATFSNYPKIRNYSIDIKTANELNTFTYLLDGLKTNAINNKRINYDKLIATMSEMKDDNKIVETEGLFLLKLCTMLPERTVQERHNICQLIWSKILNASIANNGGIPKRDFILEYLHVCRQIKLNLKDFELFTKQFNAQNDQAVYEKLLYLSCEFGEISDGIVNVLNGIKTLGLEINENVFNALILGYGKNHNLKNCQLAMDTMQAADILPSTETYKELICAYIENRELEKGLKMLKEHEFTESQIIDMIIRITLTDTQQTDAVKKVLTILINCLSKDTLNNRNIISDIRNICIELISLNRHRDAYEIIEMLPIPQFNQNDDLDSYGRFFLNELCKKNIPSVEIIEICQKFIASKRNVRALHVGCELALKNKSKDVLDFFGKLLESEPLRAHYFWPIFIEYSKLDGESGILQCLKEMQMLNVKCNMETLTSYVLPNLPITLKDVRQCILILQDHNIQMNELITPLIGYLLTNQRFDDILNTVLLYKSKINTDALVWPLILATSTMKSNNSYTKLAEIIKQLNEKSINKTFNLSGEFLLELSGRLHDFSLFERLINELKELNVKISMGAYQLIWQQFSTSKNINTIRTMDILKQMVQTTNDYSNNSKPLSTTTTTATVTPSSPTSKYIESMEQSYIQHPKNMTVDELELHLIELQSKGMNCRGVLRKLLQQLVRNNKLERALEVKKLCEQERVDMSPGMLSSIFDLMVKTKNLVNAKKTLEKLKTSYSNFHIDDHKIIDYAALLIEHNEMDAAKRILKDQPKNKFRMEGKTKELLKNVWQLLTNVAVWSSKNNTTTNVTKEFLQYLLKLDYCIYHNTIFGPVIREHLLKYEIVEAIDEYCLIAKTHRKTPLQRELLIKLIEITNMTADDALLKYDITSDKAKELLERVVTESKSIHGGTNTNMLMILAVAQSGTENQLRKILIDPSVKLPIEPFFKECEYLNANGKLEILLKLAKCLRGLGHQLKEQDIYQFVLKEFSRDNNYVGALELFESIAGDDEFKLTNEFMRDLVDLIEKNNLEIPTNVKLHAKAI